MRNALAIAFGVLIFLSVAQVTYGDLESPTPVEAAEIKKISKELEAKWSLERIRHYTKINLPVPVGHQLYVMDVRLMGRLHKRPENSLDILWLLEQKPLKRAMCSITANDGTNTWVVALGRFEELRHGRNGVEQPDKAEEELQQINLKMGLAWPLEKIVKIAQLRKPLSSLSGGPVVSIEKGGMIHPGSERPFDFVFWRLGKNSGGRQICYIFAAQGKDNWLIASGDFAQVLAGKSDW